MASGALTQLHLCLSWSVLPHDGWLLAADAQSNLLKSEVTGRRRMWTQLIGLKPCVAPAELQILAACFAMMMIRLPVNAAAFAAVAAAAAAAALAAAHCEPMAATDPQRVAAPIAAACAQSAWWQSYQARGCRRRDHREVHLDAATAWATDTCSKDLENGPQLDELD